MYLIILTLLLSYLTVFAEPDINQSLTPAQFREQELQRIRSGIEKQAATPILSVQADYDVVYYDINLDVRNYAAKSISGNVAILARSLSANLDQMVLDLCASMSVDSVKYASGSLSFSRNLAILTVSLNRIYTIGEMVQATVYYHGTPCDTVTSFGYYTHGNSIPAIASLSEPVGARDWWPCKDNPNDKADSVGVSITCADTLTASSNGLLESVVAVAPNSKTFHFFERHPIATYLVCASVTNYTLLNDWYVTLNGDSMPIKHYCFPERLAQAQVSWNNLSQMITFFAQSFNEYPFADEKYGHTMFEWGGGMEHQTNTSLGYFLANGNHGYDWILAHELSHQWWGDNVTCDTWPDIWLNEGFASYMEALWSEHVGGASALRAYQNGSNSVSDPSGPVYNPTDLFSSNDVYNKGSWILHMLRGVIRNDSAFFSAMRYYRSQHEYSTATTAEFLSDMSTALGFDVDAYLHAFIYRTNRPTFRVSYGTGTVDGQKQTVVRIRQTQSNADTTFRTRLDLRFANGVDTLRTRVENASRAERYFVNPSFTPSQLTVDPDSWVLKTVINASMALTILNSDLDNGQQAVAYVDSLVAISGTPSYSWRVIGTPLPSGLVLSNNGVITGTPTVHGTFPITFVVNDNASHADTSILSIHITAPTPSAPTALTVRAVDSQLIELNWQGTGADSFQVFRATNSDMTDMQLIAIVSQTILQDSIDIATEARIYYFVKGFVNP